MKHISLYYKDGSSDKEYHAEIKHVGAAGYCVDFQYGRRGSTLTAGTKTRKPVSEAEAQKIFDKLVKEKKAKGYTEGEAGTPYAGGNKEERKSDYAVQLLNPIEDLKHIINDTNWCAQEKYDGKRMLLQFLDGSVTAINRSGLECGAPLVIIGELVDLIYKFCETPKEFVIDGECVGDKFYAFDVLVWDGEDIRHKRYIDRHTQLLEFYPVKFIAISEIVLRFKQRFVDSLKEAGKEGAVFKRIDAPYKAGRPNSGGSQFKYKFVESATCSVVGHNPSKRSIRIAVRDSVSLIEVGNVTIPPNYDVPNVCDLIEVQYLYAYPGGSLYQPVYKGIREDKTEADKVSSLKFKAGATA